MKRIYFDHAATTPARPEAIAAMQPLLGEGGYNASSLYAEGRAARAALDAARSAAARVLGAKPREIIFTGSGSESIALAILGAARARADAGRHIITSLTEHQAVLRSVDVLEAEGWSSTRLPVDSAGRIDPETFARALRPDTTVASIMLANNEIGTIAPVAQLAQIARSAGVLFHTDAVAAPNSIPLDASRLGVDLLSLAAHKCYGPKGVGLLFARSGTPLAPQIVGGGQEHGLRAGTENVAGIAGFAVALELAQTQSEENGRRMAMLRDRLETGIAAAIQDVRVNGSDAERLPNISSIAFGGAVADALLIALDLAGIAASAGSACAAGSLEPSHVVAALGLTPWFARGVIRFSLGHTTTIAEVESVLTVLPQLVSVVREAEAVV